MGAYQVVIIVPAVNSSSNESLLHRFQAADDEAAVAYLNNVNNQKVFVSGGVNWKNWCVLRPEGGWSASHNIPFKGKKVQRG